MKLPDKPSELIRIALHDLRLCENDPTYRINMREWHMPRDDVCHICLAGAVLAQSFGASDSVDLFPDDFPENTEKLHALNYLRSGCVRLALEALGLDEDIWWIDKEYSVSEYEKNRDTFFNDMHRMADYLEAVGY